MLVSALCRSTLQFQQQLRITRRIYLLWNCNDLIMIAFVWKIQWQDFSSLRISSDEVLIPSRPYYSPGSWINNILNNIASVNIEKVCQKRRGLLCDIFYEQPGSYNQLNYFFYKFFYSLYISYGVLVSPKVFLKRRCQRLVLLPGEIHWDENFLLKRHVIENSQFSQE